MPRNLSEPVERVHVLLFVSDLAVLRKRYGASIGMAPAVRQIVRQFLKRLEPKLEENAEPVEELGPEVLEMLDL